MLNEILLAAQDYLRFNLHGLLNIAAGVFNITVGTIVLLKNPKSNTHRAFFLITFSATIWVISFGMISLVEDPQDARFWHAISFGLGVPFISPAFYACSVYFRDETSSDKFIPIFFLVALAIAFPFAFFNEHLIDMKTFTWGLFPVMKPDLYSRLLWVILVAFFTVVATLAMAKTYLCWREETIPFKKIQYRLFMIGMAIAYLGSSDFLLSIGLNIYAHGYIALTIFIMIVSYCMIKHQFLDINLLVKRISLFILIYMFLIFLIASLYYLLVSTVFQDLPRDTLTMLLMAGLAFGAILSMGPVVYAYMIRTNFWLKEKVSTGLTHELKSPLGSIQSAVDIMDIELANTHGDTARLRSYMELIKRNADRMEGFVGDLLNVAAIQENQTTLNLEPVDLVDLANSVYASMKPVADRKGIALSIASEIQALTLTGDKEKLLQVITNLFSNAIKFTAQGEVALSISRLEAGVKVSVRDTGLGIPRSDLDRVFDRFFQGRTGAKGAGIGLTIAKAWVEAHGGKIWAESEGEVGRGAKISFTLPL